MQAQKKKHFDPCDNCRGDNCDICRYHKLQDLYDECMSSRAELLDIVPRDFSVDY